MKKEITLLAALLITQFVIAQSSGLCISCNNNVIDTLNHASAIGSDNISTGLNSFACGFQNEATGNYSFAGGQESTASGLRAFAFGQFAEAHGSRSLALGKYVTAVGGSSVAIGRYVNTSTPDAMVIGYGTDINNYLTNNTPNSLMIGFNSESATFFVGPSDQTGLGKVGIGTTNPTERLEINGTFKVNGFSYMSTINLDDSDIWYIDELAGHDGLKFKGKTLQTETQMILTENGKLGIGTLEPIASLQVKNGDIFIEDIEYGIVMKSPDGNCWRGTLNNNGTLQFVQLNCDDLMTDSDDHTEKSADNLNIYPNPAGDKIFIRLDSGFAGSLLEILDINGKIMYSERLINYESYIDINAYKSGLYIFNLTDETGNVIVSKKIAKR